MCGYCTEGIMVQKFVDARFSGSQIEIDDLFLPQYLQDYEDFNEIIQSQLFSTQYLSDISDELVDILFCRLYDQFFSNGHDGILFNYLLEIIGVRKANNFFTARCHCHDQWFHYPTLKMLAKPDLYQDKNTWDGFILNDSSLTSTVIECLNHYSDWWLFGKNRTKDLEHGRRFLETGIFDPIMDTPKEEWAKFYSIFPNLYFALVFLTRTQPRLKTIKTIALTCPDGTSDLLGNDLWLQRVAFLTCVKEYGINFIIANIQKIRPPLICHAVLNIDFPSVEYEYLHQVILSEKNRTGENEEYEVIERLLNMILKM